VEFQGPSNEVPSCKTHTFNERANFSAAKFEERAVFVGQCTFDTKQAEATFRNALIEKPENFSFDRVRLRPSWFIDTNVQRFRFTDVKWPWSWGEPQGSIEEEIEAIKSRRERKEEVEEEDEEEEEEEEEEEAIQSGYPSDVLAKTCRELSANAEENRDYATANEFHYWSMEVLRKEAILLVLARRHGLREALREALRRFGLIDAFYWALSGYGERPRRAFLVLVGMWAFFALLYMVAGPQPQLRVPSAAQFILHIPLQLKLPSLSAIGQSIADIAPAFVYSLGAPARLRPEPQPDGLGPFQFLVVAEGILGPLQIALLALAVRRRVMR
jgi:hypothetical protein